MLDFKRILVALLALLLSFYLLKDKELRVYKDTKLLSSSPYILKILNPHSNSLISNFLWLSSHQISEMGVGYESIDKKEFFNAFRLIAYMDPNFFAAINYGALFLSSMLDDFELAQKLVDSALLHSPNNLELLFLKLLLNATYPKTKDEEKIYELAKSVVNHRDVSKFLRGDMIESFAIDIIAYSKQSRLNSEKKIDDLLWLKKRAKSKIQKDRLQKAIDRVKENL